MKEKLKYVVIGLLLPLFTSCFSHDFVEIVRIVEPKTVTFTLDLAGQTATTKADSEIWDDEGYITSIGSTFENRILTDDLHVLVYDMDGDFVAQVQKVAYREISSGVYEFWGILQDSSINSNIKFEATTYRFVVLANCGNLAYDDQGVPLPGNLTYTGTWNAAATNRSAIPMWGATDVELTLSESQSLGSVSLLRAMSKVEVVLSDELLEEGYSINAASLTKANGTGYSAPAGWNLTSTEELVHEAAAGSDINGFNEYTEGSEETDKSFFGTSGSKIIYAPETTNDGGIKINVTLNDGSSDLVFDGDKAISLAAYSDGQPTTSYYNLVRNHHYRYVITGVAQSNDLILIITINPWNYRDVIYDNTPLT